MLTLVKQSNAHQFTQREMDRPTEMLMCVALVSVVGDRHKITVDSYDFNNTLQYQLFTQRTGVKIEDVEVCNIRNNVFEVKSPNGTLVVGASLHDVVENAKRVSLEINVQENIDANSTD